MKTDMTLDKTSTKRESNRMDEQHYRFQLSAEFNQFYLQDEASEGEATWSIEEELNNVALDAGLIAVGTECDRVVPVEIHISASEPLLDVEAWDHIVECTIDVPSGHLVVCGCVDDFPTAARIELDPGKYRARICYGNLIIAHGYGRMFRLRSTTVDRGFEDHRFDNNLYTLRLS